MTAMAEQKTSKRLRLALMAGACGILLSLSGVVSAMAQDSEDEDTFEQKIIKNILGGLGVDVGRPGIDYRERSPLVLPPTMDLPPPAANAAVNDPAWPREQQKKVVVRKKQNVRATQNDPGTNSVLTPDEMREGAIARNSRITDPSQSGSLSDDETGRALRPNELGAGNIFTWNNLLGTNRGETAPFKGEPPRAALTQPPPGYQTPSPNAPYGTATDTPSGWKIPTILSRPEGSPDN
jgi:hypothetical protein